LSVIFKGSNLYRLSELQKAMGHSNIMVSLTYLRGLDVAELKEEDMPLLMSKSNIIQ